ncbi:hypothetical protein RN001_008306 [Aquatica leii]|uniref:MI domain-containing protein n=1 Tax=Aquatica leii TaxID=1421715 RepID=A0AAN7Q526_9COLE|nr:hypothetical protein RN001_008306 [Aquatica leii]
MFSGSESGSDGSDVEEEEEEQNEENKDASIIIDNTETNLVTLRRTIYLTIQSSLDFEECAHKLMKMELKPGQEIELCHMFLDCCAEQRTYEKFYGLLSQRFCQINNVYVAPFEQIFKDTYYTTHRLDTNRLRNVSKFFAHLLFTDAISWQVLEIMKLNEEDTTSSSRIFIKILFQELSEYMGTQNLNARLKDPTLETYFAGLFPRDNPKNTRFAINFFTSIGLGGLTNSLREHLKMLPKLPTNEAEELSSSNESSSSSSSSSDSSSSSSESSDDSEEEKSKRNKKKRQIEKPVKGNRVDKEKITEELNVNHERMAKDRRRREEYPERQSRNRRDDVREPQNKKKSTIHKKNLEDLDHEVEKEGIKIMNDGNVQIETRVGVSFI